jgi:hypothetical protein
MAKLKEIWLPVRGFEQSYEVSSFGRVRSIDHYVNSKNNGKPRLVKGKLLKPQVACGYQQVYLYVGKKQKWFKVHQLVAEAFLPVPPYLYQLLATKQIGRIEINHKNEDKLDCRVENIEWCSSHYNANWGAHRKRIGEAKRKKFELKLKELGMTREQYKKWQNQQYYQKRKKIAA